jgi:hypothetical protein
MREAFAAVPFAFGLRDVRPDPTVVGGYEGNPLVVRTPDNVAQFCGTRLGDLLNHAGAQLGEPNPPLALEAELLEYQVIEGETFKGMAEVRTTLTAGGATVWTRTYTGGSDRWGRTHNPENLNEALSNALASVAAQLLGDASFAAALHGQPGLAPPSAAPPSAAP